LTKEQAYAKIAQLVERFREHVEEYKRIGYKEYQTRVDYINPFFKALGWDMDNEQGFAEAYREVIHEDKIKIGSSTKAPDYGFTLFGQRKFFVDAKKPAINIKSDIAPAYQVRRYGWSAKVPISIVTDFEEFSIYDCTTKPKPTDKASVARIKYITYDKYLEEFDFLWDVFAKENLPKGHFDKYVQSDTRKKGTATVDDEFLKSIEQWRTFLATNIALRNKSLNEDEINYAVQKIIDRIIFLRMCEDRGVEQYGGLKKAAEKGEIYRNLFAFYRMADDKYNSGLFDLKKDKITPAINVDNKVMKDIIKELYYPNCEYEFSVMPADILGSVYEQFLGKTIRLTMGHHAKIEEKPEVRKAGGVYYTPKYIVDYIVENTVGKLLEGKTPKQVEKIKICDPACGSGSFLIGAYQFLLDWHLKYYTNNPPKKKKDSPLTPDRNLTTAEKKRILLNNIYGVDIDTQAVEVTKLNMLLKALEGETQASISRQLSFFHGRILPNLNDNIKCGNSLIGSDFYDNQLGMFPEQMKKINAFDWEEGFPEIFKQGGFDAVIGNPPYFNINTVEKSSYKYFERKYKEIHTGYNDIMYYFVFKSISLLKKNAVCGLITSNYYLGNKYAELLRKFLSQHIIAIINFKDQMIFENVNIHTSIIFLEKESRDTKVEFFLPRKGKELNTQNLIDSFKKISLLRKKLTDDWVVAQKNELDLIERLQEHILLGDISTIEKGSTSGKNKIFTVSDEIIKKRKIEKALLRKNIKNGDIQKYNIKDRQQYLIYIDNKTNPKQYPNLYKYLLEHKVELSKRNEVKRGLYDWYRLERPRKKEIFDASEKLVVPYRASSNRFAYDNEQYFNDGGDVRVIVLNKNEKISIKYLLGILNSKLMNWFYEFIGKPKGNSREYFNEPLSKIPIIAINFTNNKAKEKHDQIVKLVDNLLQLNKQLQTTKLETQRRQIQRTIAHSEKKIDELVYELYGLSKKEIEIIESA